MKLYIIADSSFPYSPIQKIKLEKYFLLSFCSFSIKGTLLVIYCYVISCLKTYWLKIMQVNLQFCRSGIWVWFSWIPLAKGLFWVCSHTIRWGCNNIWGLDWGEGGDMLLSSPMCLQILVPCHIGLSTGLPWQLAPRKVSNLRESIQDGSHSLFNNLMLDVASYWFHHKYQNVGISGAIAEVVYYRNTLEFFKEPL